MAVGWSRCRADLVVLRRESMAQSEQNVGEQPRHLHLADADLLADLPLGQVVDETQPQNQSLSRLQVAQQRTKRFEILDPIEISSGSAQCVGQGGTTVQIDWSVHRPRDILTIDPPRTSDISRIQSQGGGDFGSGRVTPELLRQPLGAGSDGKALFLQLSRRAHRPTMVTEVSLQFPGDGWHREREKPGAMPRIVATHRLHETEQRHLLQILALQTTVVVTVCDGGRQREVVEHHLMA